MRNTKESARNSGNGGDVSYYIDYLIECDQLAFDRLVEAWKQKGWFDVCELRRPERIWVSSQGTTDCEMKEKYLMYESINHGPDKEDISEWMEEELGLDHMHFSLWAKGECDKGWSKDFYGDKNELPNHIAEAEYDKDSVNNRKGTEGYITYEYCPICIDPTKWLETTIDYTRDQGIHIQSPEEELLQTIINDLTKMEEMMQRILEKMGN